MIYILIILSVLIVTGLLALAHGISKANKRDTTRTVPPFPLI